MGLSNIFGGLFKHKWTTDQDKTNRHLYLYQTCTKTGDRRVITSRFVGGYQAVDTAWLAAGSGNYFIDGQQFTQPPAKKDVVIAPKE